MPKCPKCQKIFTLNERVSWKCSSCNSVYSSSLLKIIQIGKKENTKQDETVSILQNEVNSKNKRIKQISIISIISILILVIGISLGGSYFYSCDQK